MQPTREFASNVEGFSQYLFECPSVTVGTSVGEALREVVAEKELSSDAPITADVLADIRGKLYERGSDADAMMGDMFAVLADAMSGGRSQTSSNAFEDRLRFVEALQEQLSSGGRLNFPRAMASVTR
jgi:hypothetical protein